jgi:5-(aminomethyl)-3-furanmethanol phosphate kinase
MPKNGIFKIGGKFLENKISMKNIISQLFELYETKIFNKIVILSGGGNLANFIRLSDKILEIGPDLSHWMAILAMDINGELISHLFKLNVTPDIKKIMQTDRTISVFLPFSFLKKEDELPHDWQVTSDSIALYLCQKMEFNECYLIKEVDGILLQDGQLIKNLTTKEYEQFKKVKKLHPKKNQLKESQPIDQYLPRIIDKFKIPCIILNGNKKNIVNFFNDQNSQDTNTLFTKLNPK